MADLYTEIEPYETGDLDVGDGNRVCWETCGNPAKPAVVLHGGPGSGCTTWHRRLFDPSGYRVILAAIPASWVSGRFDFQAPMAYACELKRA